MNNMRFKKNPARKGKIQQVLTYRKPKFRKKKEILIKQAKKNISFDWKRGIQSNFIYTK